MLRAERSGNTLLLVACLVVAGFGNLGFFSRVLAAFPPQGGNLAALLSLAIVFFALNVLLFGAFAFGRLTKPVLTALLLVSSVSAYFLDSFGVVLDRDMLRNVVQTDVSEALDLITPRLLAYFVLLGVVPSLLQIGRAHV